MATLTRHRHKSDIMEQPLIIPDVPAPFPMNELQQIRSGEPYNRANSGINDDPALLINLESVADAPTNAPDSHEILPSIAYVQRSCLMTLNDLLSIPGNWNPIVPDRRHSMPSGPQGATSLHSELGHSNALKTLITNLRNRDPPQEMVQYTRGVTETELIQELQMRIERVTSSLAFRDATLAKALVSLLALFHRFSTISAAVLTDGRQTLAPDSLFVQTEPPPDLLANLARQLSDLRLERLSSQPSILGPGVPPVFAVEATLLWSRIDDELETVLSLCRERAESVARSSIDGILPPQYEQDVYNSEAPPDYDEEQRMSLDDSKSRDSSSLCSPRAVDEKMRLDFDNITMAIDRLYRVTPQLHNQRVELKTTKVKQLERARQQGSSTSQPVLPDGKPDVKELEDILDLLGKASERSFHDQSFVLEGGMQKRLEKAKQRDEEKREAFVAELVRRSGSGRLHSQDAEHQSRTKDPHALLTLPEFIREPAPSESASLRGGSNIDLTLPRSVQELSSKSTRTRSLSAPHIPWLRSGSKSPASGSQTPNKGKTKVMDAEPLVGFDVAYVAEYHENLRHVMIFLRVTGATPGNDTEVEIPSVNSSTSGESFIVRSGNRSSSPQMLPARVLSGKREVITQNGWFEIKLPTCPSAASSPSEEKHLPLLDASQLASSCPSSFVCASCSLPVTQSSHVHEYRDLPSEHWQELVEAWMCHADQKLHDEVAKHSKMGFWPQPGQALVGGSYILFEEASLAKANMYIAEEVKRGEGWRLVRCLCGAVIGRCQDGQHEEAGSSATVYRILKYAIRPVIPTLETLRIPLSAYVVEDMNEFVQAHATYRFVVLDEEEECPRILMWLFKPNIRLAYNMWTARASPRNGSIHAAKVLFKLFGPSETPADLNSILNQYPGFPQAEYLFYPMDICRQIATFLKESNLAYPEGLRTMTGLDVGWLRRA
ncbi:HECT-like Ubiquitin-conjugating enzyme (E2)-binding domain containing protein [Amanita muscaria]